MNISNWKCLCLFLNWVHHSNSFRFRFWVIERTFFVSINFYRLINYYLRNQTSIAHVWSQPMILDMILTINQKHLLDLVFTCCRNFNTNMWSIKICIISYDQWKFQKKKCKFHINNSCHLVSFMLRRYLLKITDTALALCVYLTFKKKKKKKETSIKQASFSLNVFVVVVMHWCRIKLMRNFLKAYFNFVLPIRTE